MKILTSKQIREADEYTILNQPIESIKLMERAAKECAHWILPYFENQRNLKIFCGLGNNGGDGLSIADSIIKCIKKPKSRKFCLDVFIIRHSSKNSPDFN